MKITFENENNVSLLWEIGYLFFFSDYLVVFEFESVKNVYEVKLATEKQILLINSNF